MWTDALTPFRWLLRGVQFLFHAAVMLAPTVMAQGDFGRRIKVGDRTLDLVLLNWWSGRTCRLFGLRPEVHGEPLDGPVLIVANHISWADIQALHSVAAMSFVGKAEISRWPVMSTLADAGGTIYHQRGSHDSSHGVMQQVKDRFANGGRVAVFPEGGILPGEGVKRFHARMFKVAQETRCPVQPVMIRYLRDGKIDPDVTFIDGENFLLNLIRLMGRPSSIAQVCFLDPFEPGDAPRNALAQRAEEAVRAAHDAPLTAMDRA
jgi:1-acyl-sn-glycerol-3-phosphate acyltransferase